MPIFLCSKCGVVDNTALTGYWGRFLDVPDDGHPVPPLCSACDPEIGRWHEAFPRKTPQELGVVQGSDGFLYSPDDPYLHRLRSERS